MREKTAEYVYAKFEMLEQNSQQRNTRGSRSGKEEELAAQLASISKEMKVLGSNFEKQPHMASQVCDREGTCLNAPPTSHAYINHQGYQQRPQQSTQLWHVPRNRDNDQPSGGYSHDNRLASNHERLTSMEEIARTMELQLGQLVESQQQRELEMFPSQTEQANALTILRNGKVLSEPSPPEIFNVPIYVSGDSSNRYNIEELANKEADARKEPEVV